MKHTFEDFLMDKHGDQCTLPGDMWSDDFNNWIQEIEIDEWLKYGDEFAKQAIAKAEVFNGS